MRALFAVAFLVLAAAPAIAQQTDDLSRAESELRSTMPSAGADVRRASPDEVVVTMPSDITFAFNSAAVKPRFLDHIDDLARTLNRYPNLVIAIVGHADAIGSDDYNQALSERRARSVGAVLMDDGVAYRRIAVSGRGEWEPIATNATEWGRAQNRRVEIHLKKAGPEPIPYEDR